MCTPEGNTLFQSEILRIMRKLPEGGTEEDKVQNGLKTFQEGGLLLLKIPI